MPKFKTLGDKCKFFEQNFGNGAYLMPYVPALCRIDGRAFHTFCNSLQRPYDHRLSQLMIDTTKYLVQETSANWGYTQSDEITLCWFSEDPDTQIYFDYRRQKIETQTAAEATLLFNKELPNRLPQKENAKATFDSRVWSVPNKKEAIANLIWRQRDATKNSLTMAASCYFSHNELQGKIGSDKHEMLFSKGVNWNDYPSFFKQGSFIRRIKRDIPFPADEIEKLPLNHNARKNPSLTFNRNVVELINMPNFEIVTNKIGVMFNGEEPNVKNCIR